MHTRFFENEFGQAMSITTNNINVQTFRQEPVDGIDVTLKSGDIKILSTTLTRKEALMLSKALYKAFNN